MAEPLYVLAKKRLTKKVEGLVVGILFIFKQSLKKLWAAGIKIAAFFVPKKHSISRSRYLKVIYMSSFVSVLAGAVGLVRAVTTSSGVHTSKIDAGISTGVSDGLSPIEDSEAAASNVQTQLQINNSVRSSGSRSQERKSVTTQEARGDRKIIKKESSDGQSSVYFEVDSDADAHVEMSEHGSTVEIKVEQGTR